MCQTFFSGFANVNKTNGFEISSDDKGVFQINTFLQRGNKGRENIHRPVPFPNFFASRNICLKHFFKDFWLQRVEKDYIIVYHFLDHMTP